MSFMSALKLIMLKIVLGKGLKFKTIILCTIVINPIVHALHSLEILQFLNLIYMYTLY